MSDRAALQAACGDCLSFAESIDLVIYNAGLTAICGASELREDAHRRLFEVNYFAATFMAQAFLEALRASSGTHLVVTSVAGFAPLRYRSAYAASKHALTGFFGSLSAEEEAYGVHMALAVPSFVVIFCGHKSWTAPGCDGPFTSRCGQRCF
ncbi:SDR family NAD(P)-dependent oxidoreductase [Shimia sp. R11_0]|uniref:SDR family NAD(P)-dependent oxidoreductase n=1 Tax=Shimia sp. R11_0 TaxID=2821096 RepID=UPI001FFE2358|nr:SDR family NAD(P)-dependent oxidoreductase [Shimia sp. R11_0]